MKKILIVEDELPLLKALTATLISKGFEVLEAKNGAEGMELALREHPDLILLDIVMPVMDGLTMLSKLREDQWGRDAQVILLTNWGEQAKVAAAMAHGVYDYLIKSDWKLEEVVKKVKERLKL